MENPYAQTAQPATPAAPAELLAPEAQRTADYEAAIGPNTGYYLSRFADFDAGGSKVGWNWPAFFATSGWFLYRKLWAVGVLNLAWPLIVIILTVIVSVAIRPTNNLALGGFALLLVLPSFLLPAYANAIYWRRVRKLIADLPTSIAAHPQKRAARLERDGGVAPGATAGVLIGVGFFGIFFLGVLAAIAIPAYQDYTIRAQVVEGLNLAADVKRRVADYRAANGSWPEQADLGPGGLTGKYVSSIEVESGSVVITYGVAANSNIAGQRVVMLPGVMPDGEVVWACAGNSLPQDARPGDGPYGTDVAGKYLPASCREGGGEYGNP